MNDKPAGSEASKTRARGGLWSRIRALGLIRESQLIRVHWIAQKEGLDPLEAAVALGVLTEDQILGL
jgi:hypothetical protein